MLIGSAALWATTVVVAGMSSQPHLTTAALTLGGAANFVFSTSRNTITQSRADDSRRGRTQGVLTVVLIGGPYLATLLHGLVGAHLGARLTITLGGLLTLVGTAAIAVTVPGLWISPQEQPSGEKGECLPEIVLHDVEHEHPVREVPVQQPQRLGDQRQPHGQEVEP